MFLTIDDDRILADVAGGVEGLGGPRAYLHQQLARHPFGRRLGGECVAGEGEREG